MQYYRLDIRTDNSEDTYHNISDLLGWTPVRNDKDINSKHRFSVWSYEVSADHDEHYNFINIFLDRIESEFPQLQKLGVSKENISIWLLYEYDQQCNMEFRPEDTKRLGDNGIVLCISCWQKGAEKNF